MPAEMMARDGIFQNRETKVAINPTTAAAIPQAITIPKSHDRAKRETHQPKRPTPPAMMVPLSLA